VIFIMQMEYVMYMLTKQLISMWLSRLLGMQRLIILQPAMQWWLLLKSNACLKLFINWIYRLLTTILYHDVPRKHFLYTKICREMVDWMNLLLNSNEKVWPILLIFLFTLCLCRFWLDIIELYTTDTFDWRYGVWHRHWNM
jgi:hypothetical protein